MLGTSRYAVVHPEWNYSPESGSAGSGVTITTVVGDRRLDVGLPQRSSESSPTSKWRHADGPARADLDRAAHVVDDLSDDEWRQKVVEVEQ